MGTRLLYIPTQSIYEPFSNPFPSLTLLFVSVSTGIASKITSLPSHFLPLRKHTKNVQPATNPTIANPAYIQTRYGSCDTGLSAMQIAAAIPIVSQNRAEMNDRRLSWHISFSCEDQNILMWCTYFLGACVNASSRPVMMINASLNATKIYAGAWIHTCMLFSGDI